MIGDGNTIFRRVLFQKSPVSSSTSSSSPVNSLLFIVPLLVLSGFLCFPDGPQTFKWNFLSDQLWSGSSSSLSSASSITGMNHTKQENEKILGISANSMIGVHNTGGGFKGDSLISSSSAPPVATEPAKSQQANLTIEESKGTPTSGPHPSSLVSESNSLPMKASLHRGEINLLKIETGLRRARSAIRKARNGHQLRDPDYVPSGPMYWNAKAFHRSYLEMERQFKVYVYEEGDRPLFHSGPCKSIYSMEGNFIHSIEISDHFRTRDPEGAHIYFLPFSVAMLVQFVYERSTRDSSPIKQTVIDYVNIISTKYPFWNRSLGVDHAMVACHDWGPETTFAVPYLYKHSIRALCNANTSEGFDPAKDVSFPEINLPEGVLTNLIGGPSPSRRPTLAFFAGGLHGPIRPPLLQHWENKDEDIEVHQYLPKGVSYYDMMRKAKFCLCPSGYEVASPRIVEAIYTGCVPVLISDHYVVPFSDVLNWKSFSVEVATRDIPNLKKILRSISPTQYIRMQRRVLQIRRHFEVHSPPKRYDVFHMILHSIWLRRLNVRLRNEM